MDSFIIIFTPCPNGHWQASMKTIGGRTFKTGETRSSQEEALGSLALSCKEYFNIWKTEVENPDPDTGEVQTTR